MNQKFVERRKSLKLTQRKIADAVGITVQTVSNWETGTSKPTLTVTQTDLLCGILETDIKGLRQLFEENV